MASTRQPSRVEQVASNVWGWADGGCICADARNAVTSAAATVHQVSMHRNIAPLRVTRLSRVSSRASNGFTIIVRSNSSTARSFRLLTRVRYINRRPHQPNECLQTGKRCFTNRGGSLVRPQATRSDLDVTKPRLRIRPVGDGAAAVSALSDQGPAAARVGDSRGSFWGQSGPHVKARAAAPTRSAAYGWPG
jgi:hypothetical protein